MYTFHALPPVERQPLEEPHPEYRSLSPGERPGVMVNTGLGTELQRLCTGRESGAAGAGAGAGGWQGGGGGTPRWPEEALPRGLSAGEFSTVAFTITSLMYKCIQCDKVQLHGLCSKVSKWRRSALPTAGVPQGLSTGGWLKKEDKCQIASLVVEVHRNSGCVSGGGESSRVTKEALLEVFR